MPAKDMKAKRVTVSAPHIAEPLEGVLVGTFENKTGKWVNVRIDGSRHAQFFWHEFVSIHAEAA